MAKSNIKTRTAGPTGKIVLTHGGAVTRQGDFEQQLRRSVLSSLLWEHSHYEEGESIGVRIMNLVAKVDPEIVANIAIEARQEQHMRHVPLLLVRCMAALDTHKYLVPEVLPEVIQRPDELAEFVALYWKTDAPGHSYKGNKQPLSAGIRRGLATAFPKFDEFSLAKYDRDADVKLRDVLFLCHPKPRTKAQQKVWDRLAKGLLKVPDTWEVALSESKGEDKLKVWKRLIKEEKLGGLAFLRNLRNMLQVGVPRPVIVEGLQNANFNRVLPFRFVTAAMTNPSLENEIEGVFLDACADLPKLKGRTIFVVDVSGSMEARLSAQSDLDRMDTACALAMVARELSDDCAVYATAGNDETCVHKTAIVPSRRGFALRDAIKSKYAELGGGGIFLTQMMEYVEHQERNEPQADRVIVLTDEVDCDHKCSPDRASAFGKHNYILNISNEQNGIAYKKFTHINGWSENVLTFIRELEDAESDRVSSRTFRPRHQQQVPQMRTVVIKRKKAKVAAKRARAKAKPKRVRAR